MTNQDGCPTCMSKAWMLTPPDEHGGKVVSYLCTSEYYYKPDGSVREIKMCPEARTLFDESQYRRKEPL